jgi:hypothetical protein
MPKFKIQWGLGGGFGGVSDCMIIEAESEDAAIIEAWQLACEEFDSLAGEYGLRTVEEIMETEGYSKEDAQMEYNDERESWLDYSAEETDDLEKE